MAYTKTNLRDLEDMAVKHGFSTHQEARFPREALEAEQTGMSHLRIKPAQREAFAHRHRTAEEILVVLDGQGRIKLDGDIVELKPRDVVRISPGVTRTLEADEDGLEVIVVGPHVKGDAEMIQGFWDA